jgi:hypothetical protein
MTRPADVTEQPVDARTAEALASTQIRWYPMEVLCGACGGLGCERCLRLTIPAPTASVKAPRL